MLLFSWDCCRYSFGILITPLFGTNALAVIITLVCVPVVALAFTDKDGIPMDIYIRHVIDFYLIKQKIPYANLAMYQNKSEGDEKYDRKQKAQRRKKARAQKKLIESGITKKKREKRSAQNVLPYIKLYKNGVAEMPDGIYNATIKLNDINYRLVNDEQREEIFTQWMNFINALTPDGGINITVHNHLISKKGFSQKVCLSHQGDSLDHYRDEINTVLLENIKIGNNNIVSDLYLTFALKEESLDEGYRELNVTLTDAIKRLNALGCTVHENRFLDGKARMHLLNSIMTPNRDLQFSYDHLDGTTTKDIISPDSFDFSAGSSFRIEDRFCKVLFLKNYSTELNDEIITDFAKLQYNFTINVHMKVMDNAEALELVKKQKAAMEMNKASEQRKAIKAGYDSDMIPDEIVESLEEASELLVNIRKRNQRLFLCQFVILLNCESETELKEAEKRMRNIAKNIAWNWAVFRFYKSKAFRQHCLSVIQSIRSAVPFRQLLQVLSSRFQAQICCIWEHILYIMV